MENTNIEFGFTLALGKNNKDELNILFKLSEVESFISETLHRIILYSDRVFLK